MTSRTRRPFPASTPNCSTSTKSIIVVSGYATNMIAPAMPVVIGHNRTFLALFGLAVNTEFNYPKYFALQPIGGPKPKEAFARGFFGRGDAAKSEARRRSRMVGADAEFPRNAMDGARIVAKELGLKIVYDKTYPPTTSDYSPIVRAIQATNPDIVLVAPIRRTPSA